MASKKMVWDTPNPKTKSKKLSPKAKAKKAGKSVAGMAAAVSKNPEKYSPLTRKQASLAKTLRKISKKK